MTKTLTLLFVAMSTSLAFTAQVGINTTGSAPASNTMLDVASDSKGFLPPRLSSVQRDAITGDIPSGLMIYNTDEDCLNLYDGTSWQSLCGGSAGGSSMTYSVILDKSVVTVGINDTSEEDILHVTVHRLTGTPTPVTIELTGVPAGVTYSLSPGGGYPDVLAELIFTTSGSAIGGTYPITVVVTGGVANQSSTFTLEIVSEKRVFLSDDIGVGGNMGGLVGADAICQSQATSNSLGGSWVAWLSTSTVDAKDRIGNGIFKRLDGVVLAYSKSDLLDGLLLAAPRLTAAGEYTGAWARTGTNSDGTKAVGFHCSDWTSNSGNTKVGDPDSYSTSGWWTSRDDGSCASNYRIYCIEP